MTISVTDARSNAPEQLVHAAECIGRSKDRLAVFRAIYRGSRQVKTVDEIVLRTKLSRLRVLQEGGKLAGQGIVLKEKAKGRVAYRKDAFYATNKSKILSYVTSPGKRKAVPTKRNSAGRLTVSVRIPPVLRVSPPKQLTVDDIDSFKKVRSVKAGGNLPASMSEAAFKKGLLRILCQGGTFKDWGGEASDIYTSRLTYKGRRVPAAFALKGPGLKTKLVPGRMGKNGDQAQRLFSEPARVFVVQHWREIDPSVITLLKALATAKATLDAEQIYYVAIDGQDSLRLVSAYGKMFK